jgi:protein-S-isoprenylcysteine O-methyltransferase Ste14
MAMNLIPGFVIFTITYFTGLHYSSPLNITLYVAFVFHYITRGLITPLVSRYSENRVSIWIPFQILLVNTFFHYVNAEFIGSVDYCVGYAYDPRFIIGVIIFASGFIINRISDTQVIFLRKSRRDSSYAIPKGFLYHLVSSPHYFGEGLQWFGWALMTWSLAGLVWWLYTESVFIPRSRHNHMWYQNQFIDYPSRRRALIPLVY